MKQKVLPVFLLVCCILSLYLCAMLSRIAPAAEVYDPNRELSIPSHSEVMENGYPINQNGETYGPSIKGVDVIPDLMLAQNEDGLLGYIRQSEDEGASVSTPEAAAKYVPHDHFVNMYLEDGVTVVGQFFISQ